MTGHFPLNLNKMFADLQQRFNNSHIPQFTNSLKIIKKKKGRLGFLLSLWQFKTKETSHLTATWNRFKYHIQYSKYFFRERNWDIRCASAHTVYQVCCEMVETYHRPAHYQTRKDSTFIFNKQQRQPQFTKAPATDIHTLLMYFKEAIYHSQHSEQGL